LTEYVQALAGDVAGIAEKVGTLEEKVSTLERNAFTISGTLNLTYKAIEAVNFDTYDVDRIFWKSKNVFSSGDLDYDGEKVDNAEGLKDTPGETTADLEVNFQTGKLTGKSKDGELNTYEELFQFTIKGYFACSVMGGCDVYSGGYAGENNADSAFNIYVDEVKTTLTIAEDQKLSIVFGQSVNTKFTEYIFDNEENSYGHGLVATLKGLPLGTTLTFAYGNHAIDTDTPSIGYDYFYAGRLALAPIEGFSVGASYVKQDSLANPIWGVDANGQLGPVSLAGEYFSDATAATSYYVKGGVELGAFSLEANYRNIAASVNATNVASMDAEGDFLPWEANYTDLNNAPFAADQQGFGVLAKAKFGAFSLKAHYDSYTHAGNDYTELGGSLGATFGAFEFKAGYSAASENGSPAATIPGVAPGQEYESKYCAKLAHDGESDAALVKGLNFTLKYTAYTVTGVNELLAYGDYTGKFGPAEVLLLAGYYGHDLNAGSSTVKYGIKVETDPFALPLKPAFAAGYVARSSTSGSAETKYFVGVKFKEFLLPHSEFRVGYSVYNAKNVATFTVGQEDKAFDSATWYLYSEDGTESGVLGGVLLSWYYYDLNFTYLSAWTNGGYANALQISYTVGF